MNTNFRECRNPPFSLDKWGAEKATIDLPAVQREIDDLEAQLAAVRTEMRGHLKKLGLALK